MSGAILRLVLGCRTVDLSSQILAELDGIATAAGRPLACLAITEEQLRAGLTQAGLPVEVDNVAISIQASFAAGAFDIVTGDVERLGGRPPKPLRDVLAVALKSPSA